MTLTRKDCWQLIRLLGELQTNIEWSIESALVPGTPEPMEEDREWVAADRKLWRQAEKWVGRLSDAARS